MRYLISKRDAEIILEKTIKINNIEYSLTLEKDNTFDPILNIFNDITTFNMFLSNDYEKSYDKQTLKMKKKYADKANIDEIIEELLFKSIKLIELNINRHCSDLEYEIKRLQNIIIELNNKQIKG